MNSDLNPHISCHLQPPSTAPSSSFSSFSSFFLLLCSVFFSTKIFSFSLHSAFSSLPASHFNPPPPSPPPPPPFPPLSTPAVRRVGQMRKRRMKRNGRKRERKKEKRKKRETKREEGPLPRGNKTRRGSSDPATLHQQHEKHRILKENPTKASLQQSKHPIPSSNQIRTLLNWG